MSPYRCPSRRPRATFSHRLVRQLGRSALTAFAALLLVLGSFYPGASLGSTPVAYAQAGSVTVKVFVDANRNGVSDDPAPTPALTGVPVTIYTADDRFLFSANAVVDPLNPGEPAQVTFGGVPLGSYRVEVGLPTGYAVSVPGASFSNAGLVFRAVLTAGAPDAAFDVGMRALNGAGADPGVASGRALDVRVWDDRDADGIQDADEAGFEGRTVEVRNASATFVVTGTSGPDGRYRFDNVPHTTSLQVRVLDPPAGYSLTRPGVSARSGDGARNSDASLILGYASIPSAPTTPGVNIDTVDIGFAQAAVSGYIFRDISADGFDDGAPPEERLNGIVVELLDASGTVTATTTTRAETGIDGGAGVYRFTGIVPGDYFVRVPPGEFVDGKPLFGAANSPTELVTPPLTDDRALPDGIDATEGFSIPVTLDFGDVAGGSNSDTTAIFGFYKGTVGDFVWYDVNRDGLQAGEENLGQGGVRVFVDEDGDGIRDTGELSTTTDLNGGYFFSDLAFGQAYTITLDAENFAPGGILEGVAVHPSNAFSGTLGGVTYYYTVTGALQPTEPITDVYDFGLTRADVGNVVFEDADGNGVYDLVESGIPGVGVELRRASDNSLVMSTTTSITGTYVITDLQALGYYAVFDLGSTGSPTSTFVASPITTTVDPAEELSPLDFSDVLTDAISPGRWRTPVFTPTAGVENNGVDGGFYGLATLAGRAFFDTDGDDLDETPDAEPGMRDVTVRLRPALDPSTVVSTTTTLSDTTGAYSFTDIRPGVYIVEFVNPVATTYEVITNTTTNVTTTLPLESDVVELSGDDGRTGPVALTSGDTTDEVDAGFRGRGVAGGRVFTDENGNDVQDAGDTSLAGATVALTVTADLPNLVAEYVAGEQTSDAGATQNYTFTLLPFGAGVTYTLGFTEPPGLPPFLPSLANVGGDDTVDSDGEAAVITGPTGLADVDQGYYQLGTVTARVFEEIEDDPASIDNRFDPTTPIADTGVPSVTVTLERAGGDTFTGESDADGLVTFTVKPGDYQLNIDQDDADLAGLLPSEPNFTDPVSITNTPLTSGGLSATDTNGANSFGYYRTSTIGGLVFFDRDQDTLMAGEPGVQGVAVELTGPSGTLTTTTDASGIYTFTGLLPGDATTPYTLTFTNPDGANFAFFNGGDSDVTVAGVATPVTVAYDSAQSVDAGLTGLASVSGLAFEDGDADGLSDGANDAPLDGVTVTLTVNVNIPGRLTTQIVTTTVTSAGDRYNFEGLPGGAAATGEVSYTLVFTAPDSSWVLTEADVGDAVAGDPSDNDSDSELADQPLAKGADDERDQGWYQNVTVTAVVFEEETPPVDNDYDAVNDTPLANVRVELETLAGTLVLSDTTDATGLVTFTAKPGVAYQLDVQDGGGVLTGLTRSPGHTDPVTVTTLPAGGVLYSGESSFADATAGANSFGYYQPATVTGTVFFDRDQDTLMAGEPGVQGVVVGLTGGTTALTTTTDATGAYTLTGLLPGSYTLTVTNPDTTNFAFVVGGDSDVAADGTAAVTLAYGAAQSVDAGLRGLASVSGLAFEDGDADGLSDGANDAPLGGVTVTLRANVALAGRLTTQIVSTTVTPAGGAYSFGGLPGDGGVTGAVSYTLVFTAPDGTWVLTEADVGDAVAGDPATNDSDGELANQPLTNGATDERDQGWYQNVTVTAVVFEEETPPVDNDYDAVNDTPLANVRVELETLAGTAVLSGTTDATGFVTFTARPGVAYQLNIDQDDADLAGLLPSEPNFSDPVTVTTLPAGGVLFSGESSLADATAGANSFGYYQPATVTGTVFFDRDQDTLKLGEPGVQGVVVGLTGGTTALTTTTNASGVYTLTGLLPDNYTLTITNPDVTNFAFVVGGDSDVAADGTAAVTLAYGQAQSVDAGLRGLASVSGLAFEDGGADGLSDGANDARLAGVTVTLTVDVNLAGRLTTRIVTTTVTPADGAYSFGGLPGDGGTAGAVSYTLVFTAPDTSWVLTEADVGDAVAGDPVTNDSDGELANQPLGNGETDERDQGWYQNVTVTARVFEELVGVADNQFQTPGDAGVAGVTVALEREGGPTVTADSNASGLVTFTVRPGNYQLNIDENDPQLAGLLPSEPNFSDPVSVTSVLGGGLLLSGDVSLTDAAGANSFGYFRNSTISGRVFLDLDPAVAAAGEPGLANVEVALLQAGNPVSTTLTTATGAYTFTGVISGSYTLVFTNPAEPSLDFFQGGGSTLTAIAADDTTAEIDLGAVPFNSTLGGRDAGLRGVAALGGTTFEDGDGDGLSGGADDGPLGGVTVTLRLAIDLPGIITTEVTRTATTPAATGAYSFTGLVGGGATTYDLSFAPPDGTWVLTDPDVGDADPVGDGASDDSDGELTGQDLGAAEQAARDQGYYQNAAITAHVFDERVAVDNTFQAGEVGFASVNVGINPADTGNQSSRPTGPTGVVTFTVRPGVYTLSGPALATLPAGFAPSPGNTGTVTVTVTSGQSDAADFGYYKGNTIAGAAWFDSDRDGQLDTGEPGVEGITVTLRRGDDQATVDEQLTDATGAYTFTDVAPSGIINEPPSYAICFASTADLTYTLQSGALETDNNSDAGPDGCTGTFLLPGSNTVSSTIDVGFVGLNSIGDLIWLDEDGDGLQDTTEDGVAGAVVTVAISTTDSLNSSGPTVVMTSTLSTATSDLAANYSIPGVPRASGFRVVSVSLPPGYVLSATNQGADEARDGDAVGDSFGPLPPDAADTDFGVTRVTAVGDLVWLDLNGNGRYDAASESGAPGVRVELLSGTTVVSATTTGAGAQAGLYAFNDILPGQYRLRFEAPFGYGFTNNGLGAIATDGDNDARDDGSTAVFTMTPGLQLFSIDAGLRGNGQVGGIVWRDDNRNNQRDPAETARLAGVQVTMTLTPTLTPSSTLVLTATTAADGSYSFTRLPEGEAAVRFIQPTGFFPVTPDVGPDTTDSDGPLVTLTLNANQEIGDVDMGYRRLGVFTYLPLIYGRMLLADLSGTFTVTPASPQGYAPASVTVTVTNSGEGPASNFWVDLYINPMRRPAVNDRWNDIPCEAATEPCLGIAWFYTGTLQPGQSVTLVSTATSDTSPVGYVAGASIWSGAFNNGTSRLFVLVDSWNRNEDGSVADPNGAVQERNEGNNLSERSITVRPGIPPQPEAARAARPLLDRARLSR